MECILEEGRHGGIGVLIVLHTTSLLGLVLKTTVGQMACLMTGFVYYLVRFQDFLILDLL